MQWSLIAVIHFLNALFGPSFVSAENGTGLMSCVFEAFGYSPACIASALTSCESSSTKELPIEGLGDSFEVTNSLLQEMKSGRENPVSVVKSLLQEMKSVRKNVKKNFKILLGNLENITHRISNLELLLQGPKFERGIKAATSFSDIKNFLQEVKRELENVTNHSPASRDGAIPNGITTTPEEFIPGKKLPKNCAELRVPGDNLSAVGVQTVYPNGAFYSSEAVYCDQVTDGGGWTTIQSRSPLPERVNFTRTWSEYVRGFGDLNGEFWLGLNNIHALTNSAQMELRVDLEAWQGTKGWAKYGTFQVGDAASKYVLRIGDYSGDAGDGLTPTDNNFNLNGMRFTTHDNDNDLNSGGNCAAPHPGGWWFNRCSVAHLNGVPDVGIIWEPFSGLYFSLKKSSLKIRPISHGF